MTDIWHQEAFERVKKAFVDGFAEYHDNGAHDAKAVQSSERTMQDFIMIIRRATIEDCAKVAEAAIESWSFDSRPTAIEKEVAKAIRALADQEPQ